MYRISRSRKYSGEAEAAGLLRWLNEENPSDKMQLAKAYVEEVMTWIQSLPKMAPGQEKPDGSGKIERQLIAAFNRYESVRICRYDRSSGNWEFPWRPTHDFSRDWVRGEAFFIDRVVKLKEKGVLAHVRKCPCGQYFFARFPKRHRFHSAKCRVEFWEKTEERKKQKREYASKYYYQQRNKNVK